MAVKKKSVDEMSIAERLDRHLNDPIVPTRVKYWLSTGCDIIDWLIGYGGLPAGRFTEVFAEESAGKSLIAAGAAREVLRDPNGLVIYLDTEAALDMEWLRKLRVSTDPSHFYHRIPTCLEEVHDVISEAVALRKDVDAPTLIVWDSLAATLSKKKIDYEIKKTEGGVTKEDSAGGMALEARLNSLFFAGTTGKAMYNSKIAVLICNQSRANIGVMWGSDEDKETTPGGRATRFFASVRLRLAKKKKMKTLVEGADSPGSYTEVRVIKNKVDRAGRRCEIPVWKEVGIDNRHCLINYVETNESDLSSLVTETGLNYIKGRFYWKGKSYFKDQFWKLLYESPADYEEFRELTKTLFYRHEKSRAGK